MLGGTNQATLLLLLILIHCLEQTDSAILSRNKVITSSSTWTTWVPERAIDGNPSRDGNTCECCAATGIQSNSWYELDLGKNYTVNRIHVVGRGDNNGQHFEGMQIYLKRVHDDITFGDEIRITEATYNVDYVLSVPKSTRYVSLALYHVKWPFVICELTVYGECAEGEFGDFCEHVCHCDGDPCNTTTGVCPSGSCLPGYKGTTCDKECTDGFYGPGCILECGNCHNGEPCNVVTGHCENGCTAGYQTDLTCKTECIPGTYGVGCAKGCGNCKDVSTVCANTNGFCEAGCAAGYMGDTCITVCAAGFHGENCNNECGHCVKGEPCDPVTGVCVNGCAAGYQTPFCNTECNRGTYGLGCSLTCGNCQGNYICLFTDGTCPNGCAAGYHGDDCKAECTIGTYGAGCTNRCGACANWTSCNKMNGACLACEPGFIGNECKSSETTDTLLLTISGWILSGVALLAVIGIFVFMKIRLRRAKQKSTPTDTSLYDIPNNSHNEEEHHYESSTVNA